MKRFFLVLAVCALIACVGCKRKQLIAGGARDVIVVLAQDRDWARTEQPLRDALEREVFTPNREKIYELLHGQPEMLSSYIYAKNLILVGTLDGTSEASNLIETLLTDEALSKVKQKKAFIFEKENPWAFAQYLMVIASPGEPAPSAIIEKNRDVIFQFFEKSSYKRAKWLIYSAGREKDKEELLRGRSNASLELPIGFYMAAEEEFCTFVTFVRKFPYRLISVGWSDTLLQVLSLDDACRKRDSLGVLYLENDVVAKEKTSGKQVDFLGRKAYKIEGIWENSEKVMGGPFRTYFFNDSLQRRSYIIDLHVFAPGMKKWFYLMELEAVASTFKTEPIDSGGGKTPIHK
jgi:hypothetical protein